ncbi:phosphate ABC transporter permease [Halovivax asiaticus JCM 14624]|uniref:Phosphate transport system permease protein PstA n=1 Tax=Halovivax asiaticus JCM 14624 TaxID=1227490 RepID=M0BMU3_9EURY|nr:phosphate ABC transporter permease PstA [Halovivax asiaticus]ELZ12180.1 phosphate ABC transporter permease [Halovivax asiaticus JCM 14624]
MSSGHASGIVHEGDAADERVAAAVVVGALVIFIVGAGALFDWIPADGRLGGISTATGIGGGVLALGVATGALGVRSRWGSARTSPDRTTGLVVGFAQAGLWLVTVGLIAGNTFGLEGIGWLVAVPAGALAGIATVAAREDVGITVPTAAFVCFVGLVVLSGTITPAWAWTPAAFDASIPGTVVIPLLAMVASLLSGWAGAAAHQGFGARGRQNGAFMLISLVVVLVLSVLVYLVAFVFERGYAAVLENLTVGAGTVGLLLSTGLVLLITFGRVRPRTAHGTDRIVAFVNLAAAIALGLVGSWLGYAIVTGSTLASGAVTIEPTATVGSLPGLLAGAALLAALRVTDTSWHPATAAGERVAKALRIGTGALCLVGFAEVLVGLPFTVGGVAIVSLMAALGCLLAAGLALPRVAASLSETVDVPAWTPPLSRSTTVALVAFTVACLHVVVTGLPIDWGPTGVVAGGAIDWPFVMNPSKGLGIQKGVMPALFGTVWIVLGAVVFAVPLAVGAAVYLTEYAENSVFTSAVDVATNGLWSTPSIVFGLFGLAFLVPRFGGGPSIFAAQFVLGFMLLPLVLITSREAMKSVPDEYRDASAALGVSKWQTIRSVVIPAAIPGVTTGIILGVGRIAGETAPLLLVLNGPVSPTSSPGILSSFTVELGSQPPFVHVTNPALLERASALPYQLYAIITAGVDAEESFGWGTTLVLLGVVLAFFAMGILTRRYFRRKLYQ